MTSLDTWNTVLPGEVISTEPGFLRGLGTYIVQDDSQSCLIACAAGNVARVNKLVSVKPSSSKFSGEGTII